MESIPALFKYGVKRREKKSQHSIWTRMSGSEMRWGLLLFFILTLFSLFGIKLHSSINYLTQTSKIKHHPFQVRSSSSPGFHIRLINIHNLQIISLKVWTSFSVYKMNKTVEVSMSVYQCLVQLYSTICFSMFRYHLLTHIHAHTIFIHWSSPFPFSLWWLNIKHASDF